MTCTYHTHAHSLCDIRFLIKHFTLKYGRKVLSWPAPHTRMRTLLSGDLSVFLSPHSLFFAFAFCVCVFPTGPLQLFCMAFDYLSGKTTTYILMVSYKNIVFQDVVNSIINVDVASKSLSCGCNIKFMHNSDIYVSCAHDWNENFIFFYSFILMYFTYTLSYLIWVKSKHLIGKCRTIKNC